MNLFTCRMPKVLYLQQWNFNTWFSFST